jgi:hypothetical protein
LVAPVFDERDVGLGLGGGCGHNLIISSLLSNDKRDSALR